MLDHRSFCLVAAFALDLMIGDPPRFPHPVRWIGRAIALTEEILGKAFGRTILSGIFLMTIIVFGSLILTVAVQRVAYEIHSDLGTVVTIWLIYTSLSARQLAIEATSVRRAIKMDNLPRARKKLSMIVGRDTGKLDEKEIARATVETVSESTVDGILSPLFFAAIGGAPLAIAFKAASTLDSMVGHKTQRHIKMGWASARLDDALNWIPARLARFIYPVAAFVVGLNPLNCWKISWRDGRKSPSPNSGVSEAAAAGALGVQLGGVNFYSGEKEERPLLGDPLRPLEMEDIRRIIKWMYASSILFLILTVLTRTILIRSFS